MNKRTQGPDIDWYNRPLAGRLVPTYWIRPTADGDWEPYRIDERKLNAVLAWIVAETEGKATERPDLAGEETEVDESNLPAGAERDLPYVARRHLEAMRLIRSWDAKEAQRAALPPVQRRLVLRIAAAFGASAAPTIADERAAARAAQVEDALTAGGEPEAEATEWLWQAERAARQADQRLAKRFLAEFGPLLAARYDEQRFRTYVIDGRSEPVPAPPEALSVEETVDELRQIRRAILILQALQSGQAHDLSERVRGIRLAAVNGVSPSVIWLQAEDDPEWDGRTGELLFALRWFLIMATRWPFQLWPDQPSGGLLVPVPVGLAQLIWMVLGHNAGAFRLPFGRGPNVAVRFCAECQYPISSSRPRRRGKRWFCDPEEGEERSRCANRYFSRQGKRKAREAQLAALSHRGAPDGR